jgi:uncharacterized protein YkwD
MIKKRLCSKKRMLWVTVVAVTLQVAIFFTGRSSTLRAEEKNSQHVNYIPIVSQPESPSAQNENALKLVNQVRAEAGVPPVDENGVLNNNCFEHARYMAENNLIAHEQDPNLPFASSSGQNCAQNGNAWLGSKKANPGWTPSDSVQGWMDSVGHRLWILYPTTQTVGYGFFSEQEENRAAAAIDILSFAKFDKDADFNGWPVIYPKGNVIVPATRYSITMNWRYFGTKPQLEQAQLRTESGQVLAHDASTNLPAGHKGIQIIPKQDLPPNSKIIVTVSGTYENQYFSFTWDFRTGD